MAETEPSKRRPYFGSCHCKKIRYIAFLTFPATTPYFGTDEPSSPPQFFRRCNCTWCHKTAYLHVHLEDSLNDFFLLSPLDPLKELGDYIARENEEHVFHNLFCPTCGVRCFGVGALKAALRGKELGSVVERDLTAEGVDMTKVGTGNGDGKSVKAWMPIPDGWQDEETHWLRINGTTLEPGQEGLDLREWTEKKWVGYVNYLNDEEENSYEKPHRGGMY